MAGAGTVCITGGSGFMGRHLARRLLAEGRKVSVLDLAPLPGDLTRAGARLVRGSITDPAAIAEAACGAGALVHLAARVRDYGRWRDFAELNVEGTRCVVDGARAAGVERLIAMSSVAVFDYRRGFDGAGEEAAAGGHEFGYGRSKHLAEALVRAAHSDRLATVIVRPGLVPYGPEDQLTSRGLFDAVVRRRPLLVGGGRSVLSTSYIDNLVDGLLLCLDHPAAAGETFHLCDDARLDWRALVSAAATALGVRPNLRSTPRWLAYPAAALVEAVWGLLRLRRLAPLTRYRVRTASSDLHFSNAKARRLLGYAPLVGLEEGLARTLRWYREASA